MNNAKLKYSGAYVIFFALLQFTCNANAGDSDFIRDYFVNKAVRNVVGFSCGDFTSRWNFQSVNELFNKKINDKDFSCLIFFIAGDFYFVKSLSRAGIFTIIRKHDKNINIRRFLSTDAWSLGVVVDLRCRNESAVTIFAEVKEFIEWIFNLLWLLGVQGIPKWCETLYF